MSLLTGPQVQTRQPAYFDPSTIFLAKARQVILPWNDLRAPLPDALRFVDKVYTEVHDLRSRPGVKLLGPKGLPEIPRIVNVLSR